MLRHLWRFPQVLSSAFLLAFTQLSQVLAISSNSVILSSFSHSATCWRVRNRDEKVRFSAPAAFRNNDGRLLQECIQNRYPSVAHSLHWHAQKGGCCSCSKIRGACRAVLLPGKKNGLICVCAWQIEAASFRRPRTDVLR